MRGRAAVHAGAAPCAWPIVQAGAEGEGWCWCWCWGPDGGMPEERGVGCARVRRPFAGPPASSSSPTAFISCGPSRTCTGSCRCALSGGPAPTAVYGCGDTDRGVMGTQGQSKGCTRTADNRRRSPPPPHRALKPGQSGGSVGTTSEGKGGVSREVRIGRGGRGRAQGCGRLMGTAAYGGKGFRGRAAVSGDRPIGAASCRQQHNQASCQPPPPPPD